jgi:regulator of replication initiation timing
MGAVDPTVVTAVIGEEVVRELVYHCAQRSCFGKDEMGVGKRDGDLSQAQAGGENVIGLLRKCTECGGFRVAIEGSSRLCQKMNEQMVAASHSRVSEELVSEICRLKETLSAAEREIAALRDAKVSGQLTVPAEREIIELRRQVNELTIENAAVRRENERCSERIASLECQLCEGRFRIRRNEEANCELQDIQNSLLLENVSLRRELEDLKSKWQEQWTDPEELSDPSIDELRDPPTRAQKKLVNCVGCIGDVPQRQKQRKRVGGPGSERHEWHANLGDTVRCGSPPHSSLCRFGAPVQEEIGPVGFVKLPEIDWVTGRRSLI